MGITMNPLALVNCISSIDISGCGIGDSGSLEAAFGSICSTRIALHLL